MTSNENLTITLNAVALPDERPQPIKTIDPETGEIYQINPTLPDYDPEKEYLHDIAKGRNTKFWQDKNDFQHQIYVLGWGKPFYFHRYVDFLSQIDNNYALAFRFLYLCTFVDYQTNILRYNRRNMADSKIRDVLEVGVSEYMSAQILKDLYHYNLIYKTTLSGDEVIKINGEYAIKGGLPNGWESNSTRVFVHAIRQLYKESKPKEHKKLGRVIGLLPYVNTDHNVICHNPNETDINKVIPLTMEEIGNALGYNIHKNQSTVISELVNTTVDGIGLIMVAVHGTTKKAAYVNPALFYKGNNLDSLQALTNSFQLFFKKQTG